MGLDALDKTQKALNQTSVGDILQSLDQQALISYLHDFVYLEFTFTSNDVDAHIHQVRISLDKLLLYLLGVPQKV